MQGLLTRAMLAVWISPDIAAPCSVPTGMRAPRTLPTHTAGAVGPQAGRRSSLVSAASMTHAASSTARTPSPCSSTTPPTDGAATGEGTLRTLAFARLCVWHSRGHCGSDRHTGNDLKMHVTARSCPNDTSEPFVVVTPNPLQQDAWILTVVDGERYVSWQRYEPAITGNALRERAVSRACTRSHRALYSSGSSSLGHVVLGRPSKM